MADNEKISPKKSDDKAGGLQPKDKANDSVESIRDKNAHSNKKKSASRHSVRVSTAKSLPSTSNVPNGKPHTITSADVLEVTEQSIEPSVSQSNSESLNLHVLLQDA